MNYRIVLLLLFILISSKTPAQTTALKHAHAHNDYEHERPLLDALSYGFTSVEADIYLINNELYVTHDRPQTLDKKRTLKALYLSPLQKRIQKNKGLVYPDYHEPVYLMIDIKTEAEATYQVLKKQLESYQDMLYTETNKNGPVRVVLSGNRPIETVKQEKNRLVSIDGRPSDLEKDYTTDVMPVISQNYNQVIKWNGEGKISDEELAVLTQLAEQTHKQGKKLRLWASPENEQAWKILLDVGVDFINTDQLQQLSQFLSNKK